MIGRCIWSFLPCVSGAQKRWGVRLGSFLPIGNKCGKTCFVQDLLLSFVTKEGAR